MVEVRRKETPSVCGGASVVGESALGKKAGTEKEGVRRKRGGEGGELVVAAAAWGEGPARKAMSALVPSPHLGHRNVFTGTASALHDHVVDYSPMHATETMVWCGKPAPPVSSACWRSSSGETGRLLLIAIP